MAIIKLSSTEHSRGWIHKAVVELQPHNKDKKTNLNGRIYFEEVRDGLRIYGTVSGLSPGLHGFHIHETGDLSQGCKSLKGHFNPHNKNHGARINNDGSINRERHLGDLGNIKADSKGVAKIDFVDPLLTLDGKYSIVGRSVIVHQGEDDLGHGGTDESLKTGSAGERIGCGVIGRI